MDEPVKAAIERLQRNLDEIANEARQDRATLAAQVAEQVAGLSVRLQALEIAAKTTYDAVDGGCHCTSPEQHAPPADDVEVPEEFADALTAPPMGVPAAVPLTVGDGLEVTAEVEADPHADPRDQYLSVVTAVRDFQGGPGGGQSTASRVSGPARRRRAGGALGRR